MLRLQCKEFLIRSPKHDSWWFGSNVGHFGVLLSSNTPEPWVFFLGTKDAWSPAVCLLDWRITPSLNQGTSNLEVSWISRYTANQEEGTTPGFSRDKAEPKIHQFLWETPASTAGGQEITARTKAIILKEAAEDSVFKAFGSCSKRVTLHKHLNNSTQILLKESFPAYVSAVSVWVHNKHLKPVLTSIGLWPNLCTTINLQRIWDSAIRVRSCLYHTRVEITCILLSFLVETLTEIQSTH